MKTHKEALSAAQLAWYNGQTDLVCERDNDGMEAAIRAYLDARGLVMVPRKIDEEGAIAMALEGYTMFPRTLWKAMIAAAPDPFK